jgi:hypothetical protein
LRARRNTPAGFADSSRTVHAPCADRVADSTGIWMGRLGVRRPDPTPHPQLASCETRAVDDARPAFVLARACKVVPHLVGRLCPGGATRAALSVLTETAASRREQQRPRLAERSSEFCVFVGAALTSWLERGRNRSDAAAWSRLLLVDRIGTLEGKHAEAPPGGSRSRVARTRLMASEVDNS